MIKLKRRIIYIYNSCIEKIKRIIELLKNILFKNIYWKLFLQTIIVLVFINIIMLTIFYSNAYYHNKTSVDIVRSRVGNISGYSNDYILLVYLEEPNSSNENRKYHLGETIPLIGYTYSGYICKNNSILYFDDVNKTASINLEKKEVCSIYFNLKEDIDFSIIIMLEDSYNSNTYTISNGIPYYGYRYNNFECSNNSTIEYNSNLHYFLFNGTKKDYCQVFFNKESTDINVNFYIKTNGEYVESEIIPSNKNYTLNTQNTACFNTLNESVEGTVTYALGYINIDGENISYCQVYLDEND